MKSKRNPGLVNTIQLIGWVSTAIVCFAGCGTSPRDTQSLTQETPTQESPVQKSTSPATPVSGSTETPPIAHVADEKAGETEIKQVQVTLHVPEMCERLKLL